MRPTRACWCGAVCHLTAYAGIALVHCHHEPTLTTFYFLLLCGELLDMLEEQDRK